ncbi:hypothetical protein [Hirschia baltica]|uniref:Lipoprotein n=1 Tax=Hirschia baltica (strain ATCC 49814 / DSM 5838 / IFAM 1418) TaxID=582402 RepID=C6XRA9_HIRBI|nr:hypothetical protein [Hirschia baltica]ACT58741.1 conserved hypothetical protein [Hirschia baltica ATCC 49814]
MTGLIQRSKVASFVKAAGFSLIALGISGCSSVQNTLDSRPNEGPCPVVASLYDASRKVQINGNETFENVGFTGEIVGVRSFCRYVGDDPIKMEVSIDFAMGRGPNAQGDTHNYDYFVSVTRRGRAVIEKETFPLQVTFPKGADRVTVSDTVENIVIPRADSSISGSNFEVFVGFVLNEEELEFNRAGKRFRVNAGQD